MNNNETQRSIKNYQVLRILYQKNILGNKIDKEEDIKIGNRETLEYAFNRFSTQRNLVIEKEECTYYYLVKDGKYSPLECTQSIRELGLKSGDTIKITNEIILNKKKGKRDIVQIHKTKVPNQRINKKSNYQIIILSILSFIIILGVIILFILLFRKKRLNEGIDFSIYKEENLVVKINYFENVLYRYKSEKNINMIVEGYNISNDSKQYMLQYIDFFLC